MPGKQRIPRPASVRPGGAPPWRAAPPAARRRITVERVVAALARVGPAEPFPTLPYDGPPAAVLVPLFEEAGEARVILTRRSASLRSHTGEVSFPGGRLEEGEQAVAAALREASEEVGLDPAHVEVIGELPPLRMPSSRIGVIPFVGALAARPRLRPNPAEVEHVFDVALADLLADGVWREEVWELPPGPPRSVHFFELPDDTVWGATARILHGLLALVVR